MKKILGLTAVLALCLASLAAACPAEKSASAASTSGKCAGTASCPEGSAKCARMSGTSATAASTAGAKSGGTCTMGTKASAASDECCMSTKASAASKNGACCDAGLERTTFSIAGLSSAKAAKKISAALAGVEGVHCVHCDKTKGTATVCWKKASMNDAVSARLSAMGMKSAVLTADVKGDGVCPYAKGASAGKACPHDAKASSSKDKI